MTRERLQKILARAGHGSRRSAESLIAEGRVEIDGKRAALGDQADPAFQRITVDGRPLEVRAPSGTWMLHKPVGYVVTASDERGRPTVYTLVPPEAASTRYVGRLDIDTSGLLLLTTDGELAHRLTHPRYEVWKTYEAEVASTPDARSLDLLRNGVPLDDGVTAPARVRVLRHGPRPLVELQLREGRKREVRRMLAAVGAPVRRLRRVAFGDVRLGDLRAGAMRRLTPQEEHGLRRLVGMPVEVDADEGGSLSSSGPLAADPAARERPPISTDSLARSIAIDGPTASGKSVVGRALAEHLGLGFVDTGLMYRACTLAVLERGIDPNDAAAVTALVRGLDLDLQWPDPSRPRATLDGVDVTDRLRQPEIERNVSLISRIAEVRDELVQRQRRLASRSPIVMAGRDIGTRVLTEARTKVFLEASTEIRARRRMGEELDAGRNTTFERVLDETRTRDELDSTGKRAIRRDQAAPDAIVIDTDMLGIDEVVEVCLNAYRDANGT
ncbi:MAG: (d)CMP kinase [Dehalococcoidia bacterium]|nr:(d)CMP kinase [Dehalococcoidia bacterium]